MSGASFPGLEDLSAPGFSVLWGFFRAEVRV